MKKIILIFTLSLFCTFGYSQKKKAVKKPASSVSVIAKADNITAELIKNNFYLFANNKAKKDTILLKTFDASKLPLNCTITPFTTKATKFYSVSWTEVNITETKLKTEEATTTYTEICDFASKAKVLSNAQTTTKIKEIHYLDTKQTVSETLEKLRKEGFELTITTEGDVVLKNKTQENKMTYDITAKKYIGVSTPKKK